MGWCEGKGLVIQNNKSADYQSYWCLSLLSLFPQPFSTVCQESRKEGSVPFAWPICQSQCWRIGPMPQHWYLQVFIGSQMEPTLWPVSISQRNFLVIKSLWLFSFRYIGKSDAITISVWNHKKIHKKEGGGFLGCVRIMSNAIQRLKDTGCNTNFHSKHVYHTVLLTCCFISSRRSKTRLDARECKRHRSSEGTNCYIITFTRAAQLLELSREQCNTRRSDGCWCFGECC